MKRTWQIRSYQEGDEQQVLRLRHMVFGDLDPVRLRPSTWHWQFRNNPAGEAFCCLAEDRGVIVGQYVAIPTRFSVRGQETLFAFSCDTMIHPEYRNQGMFLALANELYRSIESRYQITTVWGFPNEISLPGFTRRLGWHTLALFPLWVLPVRPFQAIRRHLSLLNRPKSDAPLSGKGPASVVSTDQEMPGLLIQTINHFGDEFDQLWSSHKRLAPVVQIRDRLYLNWRYLGVPEFGYRPFAIKWKGRLSGYMVIRMMDLMGHSFGALVDLFPFPIGDRTITNRLFRFARNYCKGHGAEFLTCLLSAADPHFLRKAGLRRVPGRFNPKKWYFGCRYGQGDSAILGSVKHWYITYGDTDIV